MPTTKKRILVVDDEASFTRLLKLNLEQTGDYEVLVQNTPAEALPAARRFKPDLILLDVMMPMMDGGTLAARLRESPSLESVPIIFLTAAVKKEEVSSRRGQIGGFPFLAKPVDLGELIESLKAHLGGKDPGAARPPELPNAPPK
jgi:two-component system, OmpR family, response regulator